MQGYDLIMLIVLGMATIFGAIKGFAWQVASLASIVVSYLVSYNFRFQVAEMIQAAPPWNLFLAMLILYVGTSFVIWIVFRLLSSAIDKVRLKEFDRHLGALFGLAKGAIYCLLITMFAMSLLGANQRQAICQSRSGYYIATALDKGIGILPKEIHDVVGPYLVSLDTKLKDGQQNGFSVSNGSSDNSFWSGNLPNLPNVANELKEALPNLGLPVPGLTPAPSSPQQPNAWPSPWSQQTTGPSNVYPQPVGPSNQAPAFQPWPQSQTDGLRPVLPSNQSAQSIDGYLPR